MMSSKENSDIIDTNDKQRREFLDERRSKEEKLTRNPISIARRVNLYAKHREMRYLLHLIHLLLIMFIFINELVVKMGNVMESVNNFR